MDNNSEPFEYAALKPEEIRLLRLLPGSTPMDIRCALVHPPLVYRDYAALSYCWGNAAPVNEIIIDDRRFAVTKNLHNFLEVTLKNDVNRHRCFWIDAICINQNDVNEKNEQVRKMWHIYQNAKTVFSWIGDVEEYTSVAFEALKEIGAQAQRLHAGGLGHTLQSKQFTRPGLDAIQAVVKLTNSAYFKRMWIVQEMLNARELELVSGPFTCKMYYLAVFISVLEEMKDVDSELPDVSQEASEVLIEYMILESSDHVQGPARDYPLSDAVGDTRMRQCSDPRDKIFALLGLPTIRVLNIPAHMTPDYTLSVEEVFLGTLSWYDALSEEYEEAYGFDPTALVQGVADFAFTLGVQVSEPAFHHWLRKKVRGDPESDVYTAVLASGKEIDCSGKTTQDLLYKGPTYQALLEYDSTIEYREIQ